VRNESNGKVLLEAEGQVEELRGLIRICKEGPSASVVDKVECDFFDDLEGYEKFEILR
jgi:acylphosphatase